MSRFRDEMDLIPRAAWAVAVVVWLGFFLLMLLVPFRADPEFSQWPLAAKVAVSIAPGLPMFALVLLIGYVNADAKRRGMRYVLWTWLAALVPNALGIVIYFVLREPLLTPCSHCGAQVRPGFPFCPKCGAPIGQACPKCGRALEAGWSHCAYCGAALPAA